MSSIDRSVIERVAPGESALRPKVRSSRSPLWLFTLLLSIGACRQDMHDQPRYKPFAKSAFWGDDRSARPLPEGTVARGQLRADAALYTGKEGKDFVTVFPLAVDERFIRRGRQRFDIYCSPCHGRTGTGNGIVVQRGLKQPTSFHAERLRLSPPGYFFDVMTNGFGAMQDYRAQVEPKDRWAIVAYIRALQYSQNAPLSDVPAPERAALEGQGTPGAAEHGASPEAHR
jgi:mono/diheme cytochrome c family protein